LLNILNTNNDSESVASLFVSAYYNAYQKGKAGGYNIYNKKQTLSAIRTDEINNFASALNQWVDSVRSDENDFKEIINETYTESSFYFGPSGIAEAGLRSVDLIDYLSKIEPKIKGKNIKTSTEKLINSIKAMIIKNAAGNGKNSQNLFYNEHANGLSIYFPLLRYNVANYEKLAITRDTLWDDFIREMLNKRN